MLHKQICDNLLLDDEEFVWREDANWSAASRMNSERKGILLRFIAFVVLLVTSIWLIANGNSEEANLVAKLASIAGGVTLLALFAAAVGAIFFTTSALFETVEKEEGLGETAHYMLTSRRFIFCRGAPATTQSILKQAELSRIALQENGAVHDIRLWFFVDDELDLEFFDPVVLFAVPNAIELQKLFLNFFRRPSVQED